ncbi:MAG: hypothetical protein A2X64_04650 [Ignavibacteria bacterium GWF2_33_9]|nr:MAG: hypothetical protein A2X64_04650 [Ignavibacteria bacterium GWF2_33_9]
MKKKYIYILLIFLIFLGDNSFLYCFDFEKGSIDTMIAIYPGEGQNSGQSPEYFPQNIFGIPSRIATANTPEVSEDQICSLGLGGEIIVGFKNKYIYDGEGPDFTIFENAFISPINKKVFAEPGIVSVSEDGVNYIQFPYDYNTLEGCAGISPTNGKEDPFDPLVSGGDAFDLSKIGLKKIKYIKIKDFCLEILEDENHEYYDPIMTGFDLDAVTSMYLINENVESVNNNFQKEFSGKIQIPRENLKEFLYKIKNQDKFLFMIITDLIGRKIQELDTKSGIYELNNMELTTIFIEIHFRDSEIIYYLIQTY